MKYSGLLLLVLVLLFPLMLKAEGGAGNNVVVIDGKRFIPLRGVRHFYGSSKPMPIAINKYVRKPVSAGNFHNKAPAVLMPEQSRQDNAVTSSVAQSPAPVASTVSKPDNNILPNAGKDVMGSKVLSIFAPEEKASSLPPAN